MSERKIKTCNFCDDGDGGCVFPYYGLAPHVHTKPIDGTVFTGEIPENFSSDGDGLGVYTHCLNCGGDGTYEGTSIEAEGG
ncbi:hypothetical protein [Acinetobacter ursingii]|uniref:hypothetical protein n=1 Tax=Acinetobacter ursingii TaxID=108980 RepID=UPI001250345B|nr:hypothetical protein [Acinetobacter ursingii]